MFHPHAIAMKAKRAGSIKERTDSLAACHCSNCEFITDRTDQYSTTLDSTQDRMIWSLSYRNFFYRGGLDTSICVWGWRDLTLKHIRRERKQRVNLFSFFLLLIMVHLCSIHTSTNTHTHMLRLLCPHFNVTLVLLERVGYELARWWEKSVPLTLWGLTVTCSFPMAAPWNWNCNSSSLANVLLGIQGTEGVG